MKLHSLLTHLPRYELARGVDTVEVTGLAYDSREVQAGDVFVCWSGLQHDGHDYIDEALHLGAVAVVAERHVGGNSDGSPSDHIPYVVVDDGREALALLSAAFYGFPSRRLRLIGVTGTNGKTTTTHLIKAVLEQAGHNVGLIGTIRHLIGNEIIQSHRTTPESLDLQRLLFQMAQRGMDYAIMEVSSHALALRRVVGAEFDVAVFTNLSQDHLDFHADMEQYFQAKTELFAMTADGATKRNKAVITNVDDAHGRTLGGYGDERVIGYGIGSPAESNGADGERRTDVLIGARDVRVRPEGVSYDAVTPAGTLGLTLQLTGRFNVYNSLAATAVGWHEGVALPFIRTALEKVAGVPGRLERIEGPADFTVLVDYAHTPDSLRLVLETSRQFTAGRIIVVFGCGGDRDADKRPLMGDIAAQLADFVIITADNPRSEDPAAICADVVEGIDGGEGAQTPYEVIVERRDAIRRAVSVARRGDVVLIAGKGHETTQIFQDRTIHFDDREVAARALKERFGDAAPNG